jgi:hypothetical protein
MREVRTGWQIQKFVRLLSIRDRFEVLVGMNIHCHDDVKSLTSSFNVEPRSPILDLGKSLVLRE